MPEASFQTHLPRAISNDENNEKYTSPIAVRLAINNYV